MIVVDCGGLTPFRRDYDPKPDGWEESSFTHDNNSDMLARRIIWILIITKKLRLELTRTWGRIPTGFDKGLGSSEWGVEG